MRKLVVSIHSTANNIVTGPPDGDETDFPRWAQPGIDQSTNQFLTSLDGVDTMVLGRGTYEDLVRKWPNVQEWPDVPDVAVRIAEKINTAHKFVVTSRSTDQLDWGAYEPATPIAGPDLERQIHQLKAAEGGDIITFGSPVLVQALTNAALVDEYRIIVHPVIMHEGRRLFEIWTVGPISRWSRSSRSRPAR
ncbi:Dihydrofolate reductase [Friedmanniella luteola]|uniref:Dihydrofolate reductase n=1 Tax=Friedmanniella luteola TaxID=546871 RepID=A0A1H1SVG3_9ACTN|nr:dihydrofolate reductase family protein [Friedmanniella luteola]SDS51921.1 Dihydrofolate reductase [Friedmanniella luteola]